MQLSICTVTILLLVLYAFDDSNNYSALKSTAKSNPNYLLYLWVL